MAGLLDFLSPQENPSGFFGLRGALMNFANPELAMKMQMLRAQTLADRQAGEFLGGGGDTGGQPTQAPAAAPAAQPAYGSAIAGIESSGKYDALGPVTKTGDRAYGKYQVMGQNVGPWTKEVLGKEMTPQEFVSSPQAQDAVFNAKFGNYVSKYGPEGAARAWFAGEGGMNDLGRKDQLGTTVGAYGQKFAQNLQAGQAQPAQAQPAQSTQPTPTGSLTDNATQGQINRLSQMLTNPLLSENARTAIKTRIEALQKAVEPTTEIKNYNLYRQQELGAGRKPSTFEDWRGDAAVKESERRVNEKVFGVFTDRLNTGMDQASSAADAIRSTNDLRAQLDAKGGIFSGAWAENRLALAKLTEFLGKPLDPRVTNTETFKSAVGQQVAALVKNFGAGTSITDGDRKYAAMMAAGDITLDETSIRRVFDILEKMNRAKIDKHNDMVEKVKKGAPAGSDLVGAFRVDVPDAYKPATQPTQTQSAGLPAVGGVVNGYRYLGGNPNNQASWAPAGQ